MTPSSCAQFRGLGQVPVPGVRTWNPRSLADRNHRNRVRNDLARDRCARVPVAEYGDFNFRRGCSQTLLDERSLAMAEGEFDCASPNLPLQKYLLIPTHGHQPRWFDEDGPVQTARRRMPSRLLGPLSSSTQAGVAERPGRAIESCRRSCPYTAPTMWCRIPRMQYRAFRRAPGWSRLRHGAHGGLEMRRRRRRQGDVNRACGGPS